MILEILQYPNPILKKVSLPIISFDDSLKELVSNMFETLYDYKGVGLAAVQVGVLKSLFVMDTNRPLVFINPKIKMYEGDLVLMIEGCLSFSGIVEKIERYPVVTVTAYDINGIEFTETFNGLEAQCVAHEFDHTQGITIIDELSPLRRERVMKLLKKGK